jgi:hypothetical protein
MMRFREYPPQLLFAVLFILMLTLAAIAEATGSSIAGRILIVLIPFSAVVLGAVSALEAQSTIEIALALVLVCSGFAATTLAVIGAGPFSNLFVDIAIIGSIFGIKFTQPLQTTVQAAQRLVH